MRIKHAIRDRDPRRSRPDRVRGNAERAPGGWNPRLRGNTSPRLLRRRHRFGRRRRSRRRAERGPSNARHSVGDPPRALDPGPGLSIPRLHEPTLRPWSSRQTLAARWSITSLDNLVLLCAWHHRLLHEAGFSATLREDGELEVRTPAGALLPAHPALATNRPIVEWDAGAVEWHGDQDSPEVDEWTTMPSWDGERMDLDWVVGTLV